MTITPRNTPRFALALVAMLCSMASAPGLSAASGGGAVTLEIEAAKGVWTDLDVGLATVEQGPVTLAMKSPAHELTVHGNRLVLTPLDDGSIDGVFEAEIEGWGDLEIELRTLGGVTPMQDRVVAKRQWVRAEATIRLETAPTGYWLTISKAFRPTIGVQIESELAGQMIDACRGMKALPMFAALDCDALSAALARVQIPMPEPGTRYHISAALLTPEERAVFDRFAQPPAPSAD